MGMTVTAERKLVESLRRVCYAGLDHVTLRTELAQRLTPAMPIAAYAACTTDPDVGLTTHMVADGIPEGISRGYIERVYPWEEARLSLDAAMAGKTLVSIRERSPAFRALLEEGGFEHEINVLAVEGGSLWGTFCILREAGASAFGDREIEVLRRISPHIARGLRSAALLDSVREDGAVEEATSTPGLLVLDDRNRIGRRNAVATEHLRDLADEGVVSQEVPYAIAAATLYLRHLQRQSAEDPDLAAEATLRVRGRSGRWYAIRASAAEPDANGDSLTFVITEPLRPRDLAPMLGRLYGLTPREREVLTHVIRGESTKHIAQRLHLSPYTVQDHLDHACEKVGVRGRKALLAKLIFDAYPGPVGTG